MSGYGRTWNASRANTPGIPTIESARLRLRALRLEDFDTCAAMWREPAAVRFVGVAGFHDIHRDITPSLEGTMEAGWLPSAEVQGKGMAEEAMRAALAWADRRHPARRVTGITRPDHGASMRRTAKRRFRELARANYSGGPMVPRARTAPALPP